MDFHGDRLLLADVDGKPHVVLRPAVEVLGLDYKNQLDKLRGKSWATVVLSTTVAADGRIREMVTVDVGTFLMLLANGPPGHMPPTFHTEPTWPPQRRPTGYWAGSVFD
jgi:P22_AR N-terminal domain